MDDRETRNERFIFLSGWEIAQRNSIGMWHTQMSSSLKFWICQTENTPKTTPVRERQKRL